VKKLLLFLILLGGLIIAGTYWFKYRRAAEANEEPFTLAAVDYGNLTETVSATGLIQPIDILVVSSPLSGKVVQIYPAADLNKTVAEGEPLLKLDDQKAQLDLAMAQTGVRLAEADVKRAQALQTAAETKLKRVRSLLEEQHVGTQLDLDEAEMQLKAAHAAVAAAQVKVEHARDGVKLAQYGLDLTVVKVPAGAHSPGAKQSYTILDRKVTEGQLIGPPVSSQLITLANNLERVQVHAQVSENDIAKVSRNQVATFTVYAYSEDNTQFNGKVTQIGQMPTNLHGAVFYETLIDVADNRRDPKSQEWMLRPGMTAAVDITLRTHHDVWKIPTAALSFQLDEHYQTEAAKEKLAHWQGKPKAEEWKLVWILRSDNKPWPIFVRIGGRNAAGETGITDSQYNEVLEWDPDLNPKPDPRERATWPQVLTGAPPVTKRGLFNTPNVKFF
jgi:HlyD family secretion protein